MARKRPRKPRKPSGTILVCETCHGGGSRYRPDNGDIIECPGCKGTGLPHGSMESRNQEIYQPRKTKRTEQSAPEICSAEMDE